MTKNNKNCKKDTPFPAGRAHYPPTQRFLADPRIMRLLSVFNGTFYNWIHAANSYQGGQPSKPAYTTEKGYPLEPRILAELYFDPSQLVGLRFDQTTRWAGFDIDAGSKLNPCVPSAGVSQAAAAATFDRLKECAERHGLLSPTHLRTSFSGGLWIVWEFSKPLPTIQVAALLKIIAEEAGLPLRSGQLEAFPNFKAFHRTSDRRKYSSFKAYRLPMQPETGAMVLDDDLEPISGELHTLLDHMAFSASRINLEDVERGCALAYEECKRRNNSRFQSNSIKLHVWIADLERTIAGGFTAHHQTNLLLGKIACLGIIRDGLQDEELATFIEQTITAAPGYDLWCRHKHEISARAKDWAKSAQSFYWHICDQNKSRKGSFRAMFDRAGHGAHESQAQAYHQKRASTVLEQLTAALEALQGQTVPTLSHLFQTVCQKARELFGKAFSKRTWQKYKEQLGELIASLIQPPLPQSSSLPAEPETTLKEPEIQAQSQSTPCLQNSPEKPPLEAPEIQAQSQSTPCSPIMKVFEWAQSHLLKPEVIPLLQSSSLWQFTGRFASILLPSHLPKGSPSPFRLHSLRSGALVQLVSAWHTSWLRDDPQELFVYVQPQNAQWENGILVPFRELQKLE